MDEAAATSPTQGALFAKGRNGQVSFDGQFVTLSRKGFIARATVGKGEKRIPLQSITAVQWKPAGVVMEGFIQLSIGGGNERRSRFGTQSHSAGLDENSVQFYRSQTKAFEAIRSAIEHAIASLHSDKVHRSNQAPTDLDQLQKLADLKAAGVLTDAEFDAKKAQILGL